MKSFRNWLQAIAIATSVTSVTVSAAAEPPFDGRAWQHASTVEEGMARGAADMMRAEGERDYWTSRSLVEREHARRLHLENKDAAIRSYFEGRLRNREYRAVLAGPRTTPEQAARWARQGAPQRLTSEQMNPITRKITWPAALRAKRFARHRRELQRLFVERTSGNVLGSRRRIDQVSREMREVLRDRIGAFPADSYLEGKRFLVSLAHEARFATALEGVAAN